MTESLESTARRLLTNISLPSSEVASFIVVRSSPRSAVLRLKLCRKWKGHTGLIVKQAVGDGAPERFSRELVALRFLADLDLDPRVAPTLLSWETPTASMVLADLGDESLKTALLGQDRMAARAAMVDFAVALGRLHAGTTGKEAHFIAVRDKTTSVVPNLRYRTASKPDGMEFRAICDVLGVAVDPTFDGDIRQIERLLDNPGPFRTLTHGDPCPDNERRTAEGTVFLDFEGSGFSHSLLDAAYLLMAFPTCWCVGEIPSEVLAESQDAYRETIAASIPEAQNDALFGRHVMSACAYWLVSGDTLVPKAMRGASNRLSLLLSEDWTWGRSTARQRFLHRLTLFIDLFRNSGELHGLVATAERLRYALISRWPPAIHRLTDYPAFGVH